MKLMPLVKILKLHKKDLLIFFCSILKMEFL